MPPRLQRACKPETTVKALMEQAWRDLHLSAVAKRERFEQRYELPDETCIVSFWGGSGFTQSGEVTLESERYGRWVANLNDKCRIGKPWQRLTPEQVREYRANKGKQEAA
jgi:hypothetical protein